MRDSRRLSNADCQSNTQAARRALKFEQLEHRQLLAIDMTLLKDLNITIGNTSAFQFESIGTTTYFFGRTPGKAGLWKTDGTSAGTSIVKIFSSSSSGYGYGSSLTNVNGTLYFNGRDQFGFELWKSDGTTAGTVMVKISSSTEAARIQQTWSM